MIQARWRFRRDGEGDETARSSRHSTLLLDMSSTSFPSESSNTPPISSCAPSHVVAALLIGLQRPSTANAAVSALVIHSNPFTNDILELILHICLELSLTVAHIQTAS